MYDVIALGELLIDFSPVGTDEFGYPAMQAHPGGAPANFLAAVSRFGGRTALLGKVGNDAFGQLLKKTAADSGIDVSGLVVSDDYFTTLAFVTLDENGDREFSFARKPGADSQLSTDEVRFELIDESKVFHFGTLSLTHDTAREATYAAVARAKERGRLISFDPNLRRPLWDSLDRAKEQMLWGLGQADVVKISDEETQFLFGDVSPGEAAEIIMRDYGARLVYVTLGAEGCCFRSRNCCGRLPAMKGIKAVDTTGAGDIFGGSAMRMLAETGKAPEDLTEDELRGIVAFACCAAGLSTTRFGGISSIPAREEVEAAVREYFN